jgi:glucose/arabinose dehydrogenase
LQRLLTSHPGEFRRIRPLRWREAESQPTFPPQIEIPMYLSSLYVSKRTWLLLLLSALSGACHSSVSDVSDAGTPPPPPFDAGSYVNFCDLPGSVQFTAAGVTTIPESTKPITANRLQFLHLPNGFCAHYFGNIGNTRQLRFAPGGELFVASPTTGTTGGGGGGRHAIVIVPDDNGDGFADAPLTFLDNLPSTQGLLFTKDFFYYQDGKKILRMPYHAGDRTPSGASETMIEVTVYDSSLHWPKPIDEADDGTIYVGNGGDQAESCVTPHPFHGGILKIDGTPGGAQVSQGFRNPIAIRCERGKNLCFAAELARDYSATQEGREKLVPIRQGDDWGFPCCATKDKPFPDITPTPDCSGTASEDASFLIGDTPFAFDFEPGTWPAPYAHSAFVPLHGAAGSWVGARLVMIEMDPDSGMPMPATDINGVTSGAMSDFATGWDDGRQDHGRPAVATFAPDGRLFIGSDNNGEIFWVAPLDLPRK